MYEIIKIISPNKLNFGDFHLLHYYNGNKIQVKQIKAPGAYFKGPVERIRVYAIIKTNNHSKIQKTKIY